MSILAEIEAHEQDILTGKVSSFLKICPLCEGIPEIFKIHEYKTRLFLIIDKNFIKKINTALARLKCPICKHSFTYYPDFALPYKRYVKANILELSQKYVENDKTSYQDTVNNNKTPIAYESAKDRIDERTLNRSTVWRWIAFIGSLNIVLCNTLKRIGQKSSTSPVFIKTNIPHPKKYRSDMRKSVLQQSLRLLDAVKGYKSLLNISTFPDFATAYDSN